MANRRASLGFVGTSEGLQSAFCQQHERDKHRVDRHESLDG